MKDIHPFKNLNAKPKVETAKVVSQKGASRQDTVKKAVGIGVLFAAALSLMGLVFYDLAKAGAEIERNRTFAKTVRVLDGKGGYVNEDYAQLVTSEANSVDFMDPYPIDSVDLTETTVTVNAQEGDGFVFYQPGGKIFWDVTKEITANTPKDVSGFAKDGGDFILCWGNAKSERLRPVICTGWALDHTDGDGYTLLQDPSLLKVIVLVSQPTR